MNKLYLFSIIAFGCHLSLGEENAKSSNIESRIGVDYVGENNPRQKLDLYLPKKRSSGKPLPVVVYIHGGAWRNGNKSRGAGRVRAFVQSGNYIGVSLNYRLSGEAKWPAQIQDCKAAIRWLKANDEELNLDPSKIGVMGSSAGGHLVAMLGTTADVKELEGTLGKHVNQDSRVACVVDEFGPTNFLTMNDFPSRIDHDSATSPESQLIGGAIQQNKKKCNHASPLTYVTKDDATFMIIHGTDDPLVPFNQSVVLAAKLSKTGVSNVMQKVTNGGHGGFRSRELEKRTHLFFDRCLLGSMANLATDPIVIERSKQ